MCPLVDQADQFRGLVREPPEVDVEGERRAAPATDLVLGLDQVGGDLVGAAQLGELLEVRVQADPSATLPLPLEIDLDHGRQCRETPRAPRRDLPQPARQELLIPAQIELDQPGLEHLTTLVRDSASLGFTAAMAELRNEPSRAGSWSDLCRSRA